MLTILGSTVSWYPPHFFQIAPPVNNVASLTRLLLLKLNWNHVINSVCKCKIEHVETRNTSSIDKALDFGSRGNGFKASQVPQGCNTEAELNRHKMMTVYYKLICSSDSLLNLLLTSTLFYAFGWMIGAYTETHLVIYYW